MEYLTEERAEVLVAEEMRRRYEEMEANKGGHEGRHYEIIKTQDRDEG